MYCMLRGWWQAYHRPVSQAPDWGKFRRAKQFKLDAVHATTMEAQGQVVMALDMAADVVERFLRDVMNEALQILSGVSPPSSPPPSPRG